MRHGIIGGVAIGGNAHKRFIEARKAEKKSKELEVNKDLIPEVVVVEDTAPVIEHGYCQVMEDVEATDEIEVNGTIVSVSPNVGHVMFIEGPDDLRPDPEIPPIVRGLNKEHVVLDEMNFVEDKPKAKKKKRKYTKRKKKSTATS